MATANDTLLVPRYVMSLNALAERCGMTTRNFVRPPEDENELPTLRGEWRGTLAALVKTELFTPSVVERILGLREHSRVAGSPDCSGRDGRSGIVFGDVVPTGGGGVIIYEINFGELPRAIRSEGAIEIVEYSEDVVYHGTPAELLASGYCDQRQMPKTRDAISKWHRTDEPQRSWRSRRHPDGRVLVFVENELAMERRVAEWRAYAKKPADPFSEAGFDTVDVGPLLDRFRRPPVKP